MDKLSEEEYREYCALQVEARGDIAPHVKTEVIRALTREMLIAQDADITADVTGTLCLDIPRAHAYMERRASSLHLKRAQDQTPDGVTLEAFKDADTSGNAWLLHTHKGTLKRTTRLDIKCYSFPRSKRTTN